MEDVTAPKRIQLSRKRDFNLREVSKKLNGLDAVVVARPSHWGNPFVIGKQGVKDAADAVEKFREWFFATACSAGRENTKFAKKELAGKNLACWCNLDSPCHADVLLEVANDGTVERRT